RTEFAEAENSFCFRVSRSRAPCSSSLALQRFVTPHHAFPAHLVQISRNSQPPRAFSGRLATKRAPTSAKACL
ncbi:unnamed protein product, partial [Prunus brigantina]